MASVTFPPGLGGDGSTVTDDRDPTTGLRGGGYQTRFVPALAQTVTVLNGGIAAATAAGAAQASIAAGSAAAASASAISAAASSATATTAKNDALAAKVAVETIYDQFDDRYLGPKAADPTLDNDGNPLADGAFYINTGTGALRAYTIANGWVQGVGAVAGVASVSVNGGMPQTGAVNLTIAAPNTLGGSVVSGSVVLTAASDSVQAINTTAPGQSVTLPNATTLREGGAAYTIQNTGPFDLLQRDFAGTLIGFIRPYSTSIAALADNTTAAGVWSFSNKNSVGVSAGTTVAVTQPASNGHYQVVVLNGGRVLHLFGDAALYGVVYDETNATWGASTLITATINGGYFRAALDANNVVFLAYYAPGLGNFGRTLSVNGTTITVNAVVTQATNPLISFDRTINTALQKVGTGYVLYDSGQTTQRAIAFQVSGTTVTVGSTVTLTTAGQSAMVRAVTISSTVVLFIFANSATTYRAHPYTLSGTTLTAGTSVDITVTAVQTLFRTIQHDATRVLFLYGTDTTTSGASLISVSGTTATTSNAAAQPGVQVSGEVVLVGTDKYLQCSNSGASFAHLNISGATLTQSSSVVPTFSNGAGAVFAIKPTASVNVFAAWLNIGSFNNLQYGLGVVEINTSGTAPVVSDSREVAPHHGGAAQVTNFQPSAVPFPTFSDGTQHPLTLINGPRWAGPSSVRITSASSALDTHDNIFTAARTLILSGKNFEAESPISHIRNYGTSIPSTNPPSYRNQAARGSTTAKCWLLELGGKTTGIYQVELSA